MKVRLRISKYKMLGRSLAREVGAALSLFNPSNISASPGSIVYSEDLVFTPDFSINNSNG